MTRRVAYAVGCALMLAGAVGLLADAADTHPLGWALWFGAGIVAHDLVIAPLVYVAGWALRGLPGAVRAGILVSALVVAGALPVVLSPGRDPGNPSLLPLPYGRDLLLVLAAVWTVTGALVLWRRRRAHRRAVR